jgi:hypothetical protein
MPIPQLLGLARKISPSAHDGKPERMLKTIFLVSGHLILVTTLGPEGPSLRPCGRLLPASGR